MGVEIPAVTAPVKKYGKVIITLNNVLIPEEKLASSPSEGDSLDPDIEMQLRITGCELIQTSGILLKLPQVAMATGQVIFHRFYYAKSMVRYPMETTAMACVALASKIEEAPRKFRDVINVFRHIKQVKNGRTMQPVILDGDYIALKNEIIKAERRLLKELGFCCHVKHPHKIIITYLRFLEAEGNTKLAQLSWNYMNDSLRTDSFMKFTPETIACGCIWLAGRQLKYPLPESPAWYLIFNVSIGDIEQIAASILKLYKRKKTKLEELESKVDKIRQEQKEARLRSKNACPLATPRETTTFSPVSKQASPKMQTSPKNHKRSSSARGNKRSGSHKEYSRSPSPRYRKKSKKSHKQCRSRSESRSRSRSRGRSHSRDRYYKKNKKYSRTPSPTVTPPPRFTKKRERGPVLRSISRSRSSSRSPNRHYHYENSRMAEKYERVEKYDRLEKYERIEKLSKYERSDKNYEKPEKYYPKYPNKKRGIDRESKREKRHYDNGYEKPHKSKKNGRTSREREVRRR